MPKKKKFKLVIVDNTPKRPDFKLNLIFDPSKYASAGVAEYATREKGNMIGAEKRTGVINQRLRLQYPEDDRVVPASRKSKRKPFKITSFNDAEAANIKPINWADTVAEAEKESKRGFKRIHKTRDPKADVYNRVPSRKTPRCFTRERSDGSKYTNCITKSAPSNLHDELHIALKLD